MINFIDEKGARHGVIAEITERKAVNGEKSLSGTVYLNDEVIHGIDRGWKVEFNNEFYVVTYALPVDNGKTVELEFDAVHEFFYDFSKSVVYSELNGSNTMKRYLDFIFDGSGYSYRLEVDISAFEKESFGMENRLSLFNDVVKSTGVEFSVNGRVVRILKEVGTDLSTIVKKGFNMQEIKLEKNINDFVTYKKGYGAWFDDDDHSKGRLEVEYESPLSSVYGRLHADPIDDERFSVKRSLLDRVKNDVESSYTVSIQLTMEDLTKAGYDYDHPYEGDYIMAINDDLGFKKRIRIVSYESFYDAKGQLIDHQVTCNSIGLVDKLDANSAGIRNTVNQALKEAQTAVSIANSAAVSADGKHMNYYGPTEPSLIGYKIRYGDMWYQTVGEETVMNYWNGAEWFPIFNTGKLTEISKEVTAAIKQADIDREKSEQDFETAKSEAKAYTELKANEFNGQLEIVRADVADTVIKANDAVAKANQSIADVGFMQIDLNATKQNAVDALTKAQTATDNLNTLSFNVDELTKTVSFKAEKTTVDAVTKQVNQHELSIAANAREINLRLTSTQVDSLVSAKGYVNQAQLTATSTQWNLALTQVSSDLEGLEIGGRNLLLDSAKTVSGSGYYLTSYNWADIKDIVGGKEYTVTVIGELVTGQTGWYLNTYADNGTTFTGMVTLTNSNKVSENMWVGTFKMPNVSNPTGKTTLYSQPFSNGKTATVYKVKVEKGTKATDWSPAPEDMATLEQFTTIDATVKGLQTTVGNKAEQSQITQLAGQISTKVESATYTSKMTQLDNAINLRATKGEITEAILADKTVKDTRNDNQLPSWYFTNYKKQTVEEFKWGDVIGAIPNSAYGLLTTKVPWSDSSGGAITQTFSTASGVYQRRGSSSWGVWEKVADANRLISQINISPESILIASNKITLSGDTYMDAAFINKIKVHSVDAVIADIATVRTKMLTSDVITSTMLKSDTALIDKIFINDANVQRFTAKTAFINSVKAIDIAADRITAGTLNAAKVTIINLDASRITTGTITGITIKSPFDYIYEGAIRNNGTTTLSNGNLTMNGTFTNAYGSTFLSINPDTIYAENMQANGTVRSMFKLSGKGLELNQLGSSASYTQDGVYFESGGGAFIKYHRGNARIETGSYNGVGLGAIPNGVYQNRLTVGGGSDGLGPFVDIWAPLTVREGMNVMGKEIRNAITISGANNILFNNTTNRIVQGTDGILNILSPVQISLGHTNGTTSSTSLIITNAAVTLNKPLQLAGNRIDGATTINGANNINGAQNILFHNTSNRIVQGSDGFLNILSPMQLSLGWTDGVSSFTTMIITKNQVVAKRNLNMDGNQMVGVSDSRLKTAIDNTVMDSLSAISRWKFVDFNWRYDDKPKGRQFGLIAQDTPELALYDAQNDEYTISASKQIMMTSHGLSQLNVKVKSLSALTDASNATANQALSETQKLRQEIQILRQKIEKLESAA